jgi:CheY-like chemotaxis protein
MTAAPEIWSPAYWRSRAGEIRAAARALHKGTLLKIASLYDQLTAAAKAPSSGLRHGFNDRPSPSIRHPIHGTEAVRFLPPIAAFASLHSRNCLGSLGGLSSGSAKGAGGANRMAQSPIHILLVDDDAIFMQSIAASLTAQGFAVKTAITFAGACDIVESGAPIDVLVTDVALDQGNGLSLSLYARGRRPTLKSVFFTGWPIDRSRFGVPVLQKPFEVTTLAEAINQTFGVQAV